MSRGNGRRVDLPNRRGPPAALVAAGVVVRTILEDRTLREELPGYAEYAARVRWRLLPGAF